MASRLKNVIEGWENWQIHIAAGAPISLGLAGLWYYERYDSGTSSRKSGADDEAGNPPKTETQKKTEKAQEAKAKGNEYFKGGRYDLAIECYTEVIEICPNDQSYDLSIFYQNRAAAYEQLKNHEKVIEDCTKAVELANRYIKAFFRRAKAYEQTQQLTKALEDITAVCLMENFENLRSLQMIERVLKEYAKRKAKEVFQNRTPFLPSKLFIRDYFSRFANDPVHRWNNTDANVHCCFVKARDALLAGEYDSIIDLCTTGIISEDNDIQHLCYLLRGTFFYLKKQRVLALQDFNTLVNNNELPKSLKVNTLIKRGYLLLEEGRQAEALDDLAAAVRVDSTNSDVYYHRGMQHISLDKTEDARRDFEKCIQLNPQFAAAYVKKCSLDATWT